MPFNPPVGADDSQVESAKTDRMTSMTTTKEMMKMKENRSRNRSRKVGLAILDLAVEMLRRSAGHQVCIFCVSLVLRS